MHLNDLLGMSIQDYELERRRIEKLFAETSFVYGYVRHTLKSFVSYDFMSSPLRQTYIDIDDFLQSCSLYWKTPSLEGLLFYCEVVLNLLFPKKSCATYDDEGRRLRNMVATNISVILNKTGYGFSRGEDGIITIHKKDALAASVIEDMDDKATAKAVLEYNRFNMKGDLSRKKGLLKQIGDYLEPTLQRRNTLTGKLFELADDVSFCLNSLDIRHNNKAGAHKKPLLDTLTDVQLEKLYDDTYRSSLLLIEMFEQENSHSRIATVRQQCKGTK